MVRFLKYLVFLLVVGCNSGPGLVVHVPENTPEGAELYVAGNFNHWNPRDEEYRLRRDQRTGLYHTNLPPGRGNIEFKITRGDWINVETDSCGNEIGNRKFKVGSNQTITAEVSAWRDMVTAICDRVLVCIDVPQGTFDSGQVFVSGTFNQWVLNDARFKVQKLSDTRGTVIIPRLEQGEEFKVHMGDWSKVEVDNNGKPIPNHFVNKKTPDTITLALSNWSHWVASRHPMLTLLVEVPENTPKGESIYMAADFNNWDPGNERYRLKPMAGNLYSITIPREGEDFYFKFTRGNWPTVEATPNGADIDNRFHAFSTQDTLRITINGWHDKPRF